MDTIYEIDGAELRRLAAAIDEAATGDAVLKVTIHSGEHGGVQIKVGGGCWSTPLGRLDPTCTTGRVRAAVERSRARPMSCGHAAIYWTETGCRYCEAEKARAADG